MFSSLPFLGVGLSYRWELHSALLRDPTAVDWLEITPEHFTPVTPDAERRLALLRRHFPTVGHSLELSVGADSGAKLLPHNAAYRAGVAQVLEVAGCLWHGDHLCFTSVDNIPIRALTPLPFHEQAVATCVRNIRAIQAALAVPFVIENITYYFENPLSRFDEADFLRRVLIESDCGLLLDLHNLLANAINHRYDPYRFLDRLPLERVVQIHIAGGDEVDGLRIDSHSACSPAEVFALLEYVAPRCALRGVNFEMDGNFPTFSRLREELARARTILAQYGLRAA